MGLGTARRLVMDGDTVMFRGRALRRLRLARGMKQLHLAGLLKVNQSTLARWERGEIALSDDQFARAKQILQHSTAQDDMLKRLVETSMLPVHLICDRSHRLLAASASRTATWRVDPAELMGASLLAFASAEILAADAQLPALGWHDGHVSRIVVDTGANDNAFVPILKGQLMWERLILSDGSAARLVTTIR